MDGNIDQSTTPEIKPLMAHVITIFGAAKAMPGRACSFDIAPSLMEMTAEELAEVRGAVWSQDEDRGFLLQSFAAVADETDGGDTPASLFMSNMAGLIEEGFDEVCWRVYVVPSEAEAWLAKNRPDIACLEAIRTSPSLVERH